MAKGKKSWEMNYGELYQSWADRHAFGAKGEMTLHEAKEFHIKWKTLGKLAGQGVL